MSDAPLSAPQAKYLDLACFDPLDRGLIRDRLFVAMRKAQSTCATRAGYFALTTVLESLQFETTAISIDSLKPRERRPVLLALLDASAELAGRYFSDGSAAHAWAKIADLRNYAWEQLIALEPHTVREDIDHGT